MRLADIQNFQNQLELQVRQNTTGLKNINAEITLVSAKGSLDNQRFHRLNEELQESSESLMDLLDVMNEANDLDD